MINLEWFRTFKAIYETGSLTSAALSLSISQPGVSLHLNSLEASIGCKLFDRGTRKMIPTEQGKILYNAVVEGVNRLEIAEQQFQKKMSVGEINLNIGLCLEIFQLALEPHLANLPFNVISCFSEYSELIDRLENGLLDFIVVAHKEEMPNIYYKPFKEERVILVAGAESDTTEVEHYLSTGNIEEAEVWFSKQKWFSTEGDMESLRNFWLHNFKGRPLFSPNYIVPSKQSIIRCLTGRKGFAVLPDFLCYEGLRTKKLKQVWTGKTPLSTMLYFAWRKKTIYAEQIDILEKILIKELAEIG